MSNQSESEFFSQVGTGRQGVETMLVAMGPEVRAIAAPNVRGDFDTWTKRALVEVTTNENLRPVIQTKAGVHSIYTALSKAATMGLQIGGQFPHAYLTPRGGKAVLMPSQDGFIFATTFGPGAIFSVEPQLHEVYENDHVKINEKLGEWEHTYPTDNPFVDRGKLVGFFTVLEFKDGRRAIPYIRMAEVEAIEKQYGQMDSPAYKKSLIDMHRKTAMKKMLKPYVKICEGLAMLMQMDEGEAPAEAQDGRPMRDVTERTASRLYAAAAAFDATSDEPEPEPVSEPAPTKTADANGQVDIF